MVTNRRRWRAENEDIQIKQKIGELIYIVNGTRGVDYRVDLNSHTCECPDWQDREPPGGCKHLIKIKIKRGLVDPLPSVQTGNGPSEFQSEYDYPQNWETLRKRTLKRDQWECQMCGKKGGKRGGASLHVHHIEMKSRGGAHDMDNLITLCHGCHEDEHGYSIPSASNFSGQSYTSTENPENSAKDSPVNKTEVTKTPTDSKSKGPGQSTLRVIPSGTECERCGKSVTRLWNADRAKVCKECKVW